MISSNVISSSYVQSVQKGSNINISKKKECFKSHQSKPLRTLSLKHSGRDCYVRICSRKKWLKQWMRPCYRKESGVEVGWELGRVSTQETAAERETLLSRTLALELELFSLKPVMKLLFYLYIPWLPNCRLNGCLSPWHPTYGLRLGLHSHLLNS